MSIIQRKYKVECRVPSDIHEHLPTLYKYASECSHVTECGGINSFPAYALAAGLVGREGTKLVQIHNKVVDGRDVFAKDCEAEGISRTYYQENSLIAPIEDTDLLFIDSWHVYGQLKRELERWHSHVGKYIIMHDTTVDEWLGETVRCGWNSTVQSQQTGMPENEIRMGLWPAIGEFLEKHPEWKIHERFTNNHGLTVLCRDLTINA
jgi:hypothetical protein